MKKLFAVTALALLLLAGCAKNAPAPESTPEASKPSLTVDSGKGEAAQPEEGDIVIPIGE